VTPRPVLALLGGGVLVLAAGVALLWRAVDHYIGSPLAPSSTSGNRVFVLPDGTLGAFAPFHLGMEPVVVGVGLVIVVAACVLAALMWHGNSRERVDIDHSRSTS
jgi:hypothetical protein